MIIVNNLSNMHDVPTSQVTTGAWKVSVFTQLILGIIYHVYPEEKLKLFQVHFQPNKLETLNY